MKKMHAAVVAAPREISIEHVPRPEPAAHQVRVRIEGCGVCGSDLPVWQGRDWFDYPRAPGAPGHEPWGVVDAVGSAVTGVRPGMRVACLSYNAYSEYDVADAAALVPLPAALDGRPFPGEALGCAVNVLRRSRIRAGQTVAVVGAGFLGSLVIQLAARAGARVLAVSRRAAALEAARAMGAHEAIPLDDDALGRVGSLTGGALCDCVVEAAGVQPTLDLASQLTRTRGRLVIAGYHQDARRSVDMQLWNWRGLDVINAHERDPAVYVDGVARAVALVAAGALDPSPLYTQTFGLDQLGDAFAAAVERPDGFVKALVVV